MFAPTNAFSGFSVSDVGEAEKFYSQILGLDVERTGMGIISIKLPGGASVIAYPKGDAHVPATFTILNFAVDDIDAAVDELNARGVTTKIYEDTPRLTTDAKGISRGKAAGHGPDIVWFRDPSANILSLICD
ncbi:MAG: VOC family protein [Microbacteriaceae bacterium]